MMAREEAIARIKDHIEHHRIGEYPHIKLAEALDMALSALRPVSREQVEKAWRGEWLHPHWHNSESCADCSRCNADVGHREFRGVQTEYNFCPVCGAAQNDKAVEMVMERLEALHEIPPTT